MTRAIAISSLLVLALVAPLATATAEEERFEISIEEVVAVEDLLERVRDATSAPLVWDKRARALQNKEVSGGVHFAGTRREVLEAFRDLLLAYELLLIPVGAGENQKLFVADARGTSSILRLKPRVVELDDDNLAAYEKQAGLFVTTAVSVQHIENLSEARLALNRLVTSQIGSVTEVPAARAFVFTDFAPKVVALYRLIRQMDVPPAKRGPEVADREIVFRAFPLAHARATDAVQVLGRHFGTTRPPKPEPGQRRRPQQPRPVVTPPDDLHIDADVRLNQVLVTGMRRDVERVAAAIQTLDRPEPRPPAQILVVRLAHIDAVRAAAAVAALIHRSPGAWLDGTGSDSGALPVLVADPQTNSLLVQANPRVAERLRRVITTLDEAK